MRTDGVQIADEAIQAVRQVIGKTYGDRYVPSAPRKYEAKAKNAQEAHEAIRPTDLARRPDETKRYLDADQAKLYELIWLRTVASQMESAELERTTVDITAKAGARVLDLRATGTVVKFDGFLAALPGRPRRGSRRRGIPPPARDGDRRKARQAQDRHRRSISPSRRRAIPRRRWSSGWKSSASAGPRPMPRSCRCSRTANTCGSTRSGSIPRTSGRIVVAFLESFFTSYVEYDFTAGLEEQLDLISNNEIAWRDVLRDFWRDFIGNVDETKDLSSPRSRRARRDARPAPVPAARGRHRPARVPDLRHRPAGLKLRSSAPSSAARTIPNAATPAQLSAGGEGAADGSTRCSATIPATGLEVTLRNGRFGPYVQLGEAPKQEGREGRRQAQALQPAQGHSRPTMSTLASALKLLSLPREVGAQPEDGEPINAGIGRFGPYVQHGKTYANLEAGDDVFNIGLNRAVTLIAEKKLKGPARAAFGAIPGVRSATIPSKGGPIVAKNGRYGPYVSHDGVNATLPADKTPETVTLDEAVALLDARAARRHAAARLGRRGAPSRARPSKRSNRPLRQEGRPKPSARRKDDRARRLSQAAAELATHRSGRSAQTPCPGTSLQGANCFAFIRRPRRQGRHARDRPRLRRSRMPTAPISNACCANSKDEGHVERRHKTAAQGRHAALDGARRHHRPRHRRRTDRASRPNGTRRRTARRRRSAS